ncbi:MAG: monovalent cation/H+ antiporter subunit D family protein, partial [Pseudomonadota bacterium]
QPHLPILLILVPLFAALLTAFMRSGTLAWAVTLVASWVLPFVSVSMLLEVSQTGKPIVYAMGNWDAPFGIEYQVDTLSAFVAVLVTVVGAVAMPFARKSVASEIDSHVQAWYYTMYLLCLTGLLGITMTGDAFNAFVFLEISSLATYVMIAMGQHRRALVAAYQYLIMGTIGATLYVVGVGIMYVLTGSLNFYDIASRLADIPPEQIPSALTAVGFLVVGMSLKLALFPMHVWLPNAYTYAPSFGTVFLAGTATKVAVYLLIRLLFSIFGVVVVLDELPVMEILIVASVAAMFIASVSAVFETNAKRMLAYSSVAQVGYITLGIGMANAAGMTGALTHVFNHGIMKTALFMGLGIVAYRIGTCRLTDLSGIGRTMPLTMGAFLVAGLGLIGVPGTAGFVSKWYLAVGALENGWWWLVFLIVGSSLIAIVYIGRLTEIVWFREPTGAAAEARDPPLSMLLPLFVLAFATIYFGIDTRMSAGIAATAAAELFGGLK